MKRKKIQWHPGFVAAMNLELKENREDLIFEKEYNLNTKPLEIDLLVIEKDPLVHMKNEIGALFKGHNMIEYKSPEDSLNIDAFYKLWAYASLYQSYGRAVDERKADDITVSILRESRPRKLFQYFSEHGYALSNPFDGIYYINGNVLFPTQIVVARELKRGPHAWIRALSGDLKKEEIGALLGSARQLTEQSDREMADSVLEVSLAANILAVKELIGDGKMYEALMELMEPQLILRDKTKVEEGMRKGLQKGLQEGIQGLVDVLREFGHSDLEIKNTIMKKYGISAEEADGYF